MGHAGLYQALAMFAVAYFIIGMTVLSVCAIATNGALDAGGAYCILRRVGKFGWQPDGTRLRGWWGTQRCCWALVWVFGTFP